MATDEAEIATVDGAIARQPSQFRVFASLSNANYRRFFAGQVISQSGNWMRIAAVSIQVLHITDSGVALGMVTFAQFFPLLVLGPWAGVLCDRVDRHRLLLALTVAGALVAGAFATLAVLGEPPLWAFYVCTLAAGVVWALENPVRRVFPVDLVGDDLIANATSLNATIMITSEVVGMGLAGLLVGGPGLTACYVLNAACFLPQLVLFAGMDRTKFRPGVPVERAKGQMIAGFRYAWDEPELRLSMLLLAGMGMFGFSTHTVVVPLLAERDLGGNAQTFTLLLGALSLGSLGGSLHSARQRTHDPRAPARAAVAFGVLNGLMGLAPNITLAVIAATGAGYLCVVAAAGTNTLLQLRTAPHMRGRVMSLGAMLMLGTGPIGGPIVGWIAEHAGAPTSLAFGGTVAALTALYVVGQPVGLTDRRRSAVKSA